MLTTAILGAQARPVELPMPELRPRAIIKPQMVMALDAYASETPLGTLVDAMKDQDRGVR